MKKNMLLGLFFVSLQIRNKCINDSNMKKTIIILAALFALFATACSSDTPDEVVDKFYHATQVGDYDKALTYTNLNGPEKEVLTEYLKNMGMVIYDYEVLGANIDEGDTTALVYVHLMTSNSINTDTSETEVNIPCIKDGRNWKVTFF